MWSSIRCTSWPRAGEVGHRLDRRSHVLGRGLVGRVVFGFEAADDLAHLVGLEAAGQEGEQGVIVRLRDPFG